MAEIQGVNSIYNGQKLVSAKSLDSVKTAGLENFLNAIVVTREDGYLIAKGKVYASEDVLNANGLTFEVNKNTEKLIIKDVHGNSKEISISDLIPADLTTKVDNVVKESAQSVLDIKSIKEELAALSGSEEGGISDMINSAVSAAKTELEGKISDEASAREEAINTVSANLSTETSNRESAISDVKVLITAEETRATGVEAEIKASVTAEQNRAEGVEAGLRTDVDAAAKAASDAQTTANTAVTNAKAAQDTADANTSSIESIKETIGVEANEEGLATGLIKDIKANAAKIASESETRASEDAELKKLIEAEAETARAAESANDAAIKAEAKARAEEDTRLDGLISTANGNITTNANAISALQSDLETANTNIGANASAIEQLQSDLGAITGSGTSGIDGKISAAIEKHDIYATTEAQGHVQLWDGGEEVKDGDNDLVATAAQLKSAKADIATNTENISKNADDISSLTTTVGNNKTELEGKITSAKNAAISDAKAYTDGEIKTALSTAAADATSKANTALSDAKTYASGLVTTLEGTVGANKTEIDNALNTHKADISTGTNAAHVYITDNVDVLNDKSESQVAASVKAVKAVQSELSKSIGDIEDLISGGLVYKGAVSSENDLPTSGNEIGHLYKVASAFGAYEAGDMLIWNGTSWDAIQTNIEDPAVVAEKFTGGIVVSDGTNGLKNGSLANTLSISDAGELGVKLGGTTNEASQIYKVEADANGNLVTNVNWKNTWRSITVGATDIDNGTSMSTNPLKFSTAFEYTNGIVDLAWFELD
jgi:hypothetical protein